MEGEVKSLIKVCFLVPAALSYCYLLASRVPPGKIRLGSVLPVVCLFTQLPFYFSSIHLRGISAFFLAWLGTFKLLLFSFGRGPLSPTTTATHHHHNLSLPAFIATASFPVKTKPPSKQPPRTEPSLPPLLRLLGFVVKGLLLALVLSLYPSRHRFHRGIVLGLYCLHMYLALDIVLAGGAALARALLPAGTEMEPQFAAPYLSTSLQDFWGRRWNLMIPSILRPAVYGPVRALWGPTAGVAVAFLMSGLMHEVMFYYLTFTPPTGEVACFFALHGLCTAAEIAAKRWLRGCGVRPLHPAVAAPLTIGFVMWTGWWLFFPQVLRSRAEEKAVAECVAAVRFLWRREGGGR